jgi:methionine--tRNA ligase beta chain
MTITLDQFKEADIRVGVVRSAEKIPDSDKLLRLEVDFGTEVGVRQIVSGIAPFVTVEEIVGKQVLFVVNLEPRTIRGIESQGMLLAVGDGESFSYLVPTKEVLPGSRVR